jgi:hypothetical protein
LFSILNIDAALLSRTPVVVYDHDKPPTSSNNKLTDDAGMKFPRRGRSAIKTFASTFSGLNKKLSEALVPVNTSSLRFGSRTKALVLPVALILTAYAPGLVGGPSTFRKSEPTVTRSVSNQECVLASTCSQHEFHQISARQLHSYNSQWYTRSRDYNRLPSEQTPLYFKLADMPSCYPILHCFINTLNCVK